MRVGGRRRSGSCVPLATVAVLLLYACMDAGSATAGEVRTTQPCQGLAVSAELESRAVGGHYLLLGATNSTTEALVLQSFAFEQSFLGLRAKDSSGRELEQSIPLAHTGEKEIVIAPGGNYKHEISLAAAFPELSDVLKERSVHISYRVELEPIESECTSESLSELEIPAL